MLTERDKQIIAYLQNHRADTNELHEKFFNGLSIKRVNMRLKQLTEWGYIKRVRNHENLCYVYFL